jgi:preprotein translocase subunit Sec61beta
MLFIVSDYYEEKEPGKIQIYKLNIIHICIYINMLFTVSDYYEEKEPGSIG